jgi:hypothetical protein
MKPKPFIGQIVHFVQNGVHYAAIVVKVWTNTCVNLRVLPNGSDVIVPGALDGADVARSVPFSGPCETCAHFVPREWSWHFAEAVEAAEIR